METKRPTGAFFGRRAVARIGSGASPPGDRKFFQGGRSPQKMKGGNGATIGSGITQFAEGEPKRLKRAYQNDAAENRTGSRTKSAKDLSRKERKEMKDGNGESEANAVTLCSKCGYQNDAAENLLWM